MRRLQSRPIAAFLLASLLAGCSSNSSNPTTDQAAQAANDIPLQATQDTGVIRGIVVDTGVRPLGNVLITVTAGPFSKATNTTTGGAFGLDGLKPGTYFVKSAKLGFRECQTT